MRESVRSQFTIKYMHFQMHSQNRRPSLILTILLSLAMTLVIFPHFTQENAHQVRSSKKDDVLP
jgi:hypothetical protein